MIKIVTGYDSESNTVVPPSYRAASALNLSCQVENVDPSVPLDYVWSSTCPSGRCFVLLTLGPPNPYISTQYLRSYDSGIHTCTVFDGHGCLGEANITVNVVGKK